MARQPGGDSTTRWRAVLAHRADGEVAEVSARLEAGGLTPELVWAALRDGGDALYAAGRNEADDWARPFGGPLAAALLSAEVSALAAHLNSRASSVRSAAIDRLLDDYSAVTVAAELGVSRQKVYEVARAASRPGHHLSTVPWRHDEHLA